MKQTRKFIARAVVAIVAGLGMGTGQAQTNGTTGTSINTVTAAPTNSVWADLGNVLGDLGLSSNPTNYAAGVFGGMKASGSQYAIGAYVVENVNNYVGVIAGVDQLFGGGKLDSENIFSGGLTLQAPTYPFHASVFGGLIATNTFLYNLRATPYAIAMVATPIGGTGNAGGGLGGIVRAGLNVDLVNWKGWILAVGADYGNRTGAGAYNGNWIDGTLNIRKGF